MYACSVSCLLRVITICAEELSRVVLVVFTSHARTDITVTNTPQ